MVERRTQLSQRRRGSLLHRTQWPAGRGRDLALAHAPEVGHHQHAPLLGRQGLERSLDEL